MLGPHGGLLPETAEKVPKKSVQDADTVYREMLLRVPRAPIK